MKKLGKDNRTNRKTKKQEDKAISANKLLAAMAIIFALFFSIIIRIGWIQFVDGAWLKELASRQQTLNKIISPTRGAIYDTNGSSKIHNKRKTSEKRLHFKKK